MRKVVKIKKSVSEIIPVKSKNVTCMKNRSGFTTVTILRNSILDKIVHKFLNTPQKFDIDLDEFGSLVWDLIDGKRSVYEICNETKNRFGKTTEPVYKNVITIIKQFSHNQMIKL